MKTYFIRSGNAYKIGKSTDPPTRLRKLQTGCPEPLILEHWINEDREREIQEHFAGRRHNGEWFVGEDVAGFVQALISAEEYPAPDERMFYNAKWLVQVTAHTLSTIQFTYERTIFDFTFGGISSIEMRYGPDVIEEARKFFPLGSTWAWQCTRQSDQPEQQQLFA